MIENPKEFKTDSSPNDLVDLEEGNLLKDWIKHLKGHLNSYKDPTSVVSQQIPPERLSVPIAAYEKEIQALEAGDFGEMSIEALEARKQSFRNALKDSFDRKGLIC
jgi:hypothetical protein